MPNTEAPSWGVLISRARAHEEKNRAPTCTTSSSARVALEQLLWLMQIAHLFEQLACTSC